ncbi:ADP-sugar pyrophosphatase-like [Lycorma delicatula]|uniref:ADP-sugar pyrophosphatase-like n=1 Tax=Lycorma delicatula TaxID=130591 RepID=UPI003F50E37F
MDTIKEPCSVLNQEEMCAGDKLAFSRITFIDPCGLKRSWEGVTRKYKSDSNSSIDEVYVIAFHRRLLYRECIILVKHYRPALKNFTIEMPTGRVKDCESAEETALRVLKQHTGYSGVVKTVGPNLAVSPASSNCTMRFLTLVVNGDEPHNRYIRSKQSSDPSRETLLIPVEELLEKLREFTEANYLVDSRIDAFAIGLVMGNTSRKMKVQSGGFAFNK